MSNVPTIGELTHSVWATFSNEFLIASSENFGISLVHSNYFVFLNCDTSSEFGQKRNISLLSSSQLFTISAEACFSTDSILPTHSFIYAGSLSLFFIQIPNEEFITILSTLLSVTIIIMSAISLITVSPSYFRRLWNKITSLIGTSEPDAGENTEYQIGNRSSKRQKLLMCRI